MSKCASCEYLEVLPKLFGGSRFVCLEKAFKGVNVVGFKDRFGRDVIKGLPPVKKCDLFKEGQHYSTKGFL